jgi:hypothetical protein
VTNARYPRIPAGLLVAAAGILFSALGQLATAPSARADITDIINAVDASTSAGETAFGDASTDLSAADLPDALALYSAGLDDLSVASDYDVLFNGYDALLGLDGETIFRVPELPAPTDLASTSSDITTLFNQAEAFTTAADSFLAADNIPEYLIYSQAATLDLVEIPQVGLNGLLDTLFGA